METITLPAITDETATTRLDKFIVTALSEQHNLSRAAVQRLIENGMVKINDAPAGSASYKLRQDDIIHLTLPDPVAVDVAAQDIPLSILHEDEQLVILDKPAGISVHPSTPEPDGTLVNALLYHCGASLSGMNGELRPGIVHRLDKGTSGVMVVAKDDKTHRHLAEQFSSRTLTRFYLAICYGAPIPRKGDIEGDIGRHPKNRKKMAVVEKNGKAAKTLYETKEIFGDTASLVQLKLMTGRTHQIRVHMAHIGHNIIGDPTYGRIKKTGLEDVDSAISALTHQMLHATTLGFVHPASGEYMEFSTEPPEDMRHLLDLLRP